MLFSDEKFWKDNWKKPNAKLFFIKSKMVHCFIKENRKTSNIRRTLVGNKIVDQSDEVGDAPTTSSFST